MSSHPQAVKPLSTARRRRFLKRRIMGVRLRVKSGAGIRVLHLRRSGGLMGSVRGKHLGLGRGRRLSMSVVGVDVDV
jgi:hypothetical protein